MERPLLTLDLAGPEGNVFIVISCARALLTGLMLEHFNTDIGQATLIDAGTTYSGILVIVNRYVRLIDRSGLYPEYAVNQEEVTSAVLHLNEQLQSLSDTVYCSLQDLYPDPDDPECDEYVYMGMLTMEVESVEKQIEQSDNKEPLERLLTILQECASAFERAGVGSVV
jgi:hypothetical protein